MTGNPGTVLHISPHPDDESLGAPGGLMALRDAGWYVVNLACGLGRPADAERRRAELAEACRRAGFELVIPEDLLPIGRDDDLEQAQVRLATAIALAIRSRGSRLVVGPSPHDGHPGHEVVGRAIVQAVESCAVPADDPLHVMFWGLWRDLPTANLLVPLAAERLAELQKVLAAHAGELARNRYDRLLEARAAANAVTGPERVFGYGSPGIDEEYAELLMHVTWTREAGWQTAPPRVFDPRDPLSAA